MSGPFAKPDEAKDISEVNVVPLADVSLVLLIILLVLSPMIRQRMLHVRAAAENAAPEKPRYEDLLKPKPPELVLLVGLRRDGYSMGESRFATPAELTEALRRELPRRSDKKVFLSPEPEVPTGLVVEALDAVKAGGAESVALVQVQTQDPIDGQIRPAAAAP